MDLPKRNKKEVPEINIFSLPEEAILKIFHHLELSFVYFTTRLVCKKMKTYLDSYVSLGGIFLVIGNAGSSELLYIFQKPGKKFQVYWKYMTSVQSQSFKRQNNPHLRYENPNYFIWNDTVLCCIYQIREVPYQHGYVLFQYCMLTNSWQLIFENAMICGCDYIISKEHCHPLKLPVGTLYQSLDPMKGSYDCYDVTAPQLKIKSFQGTNNI